MWVGCNLTYIGCRIRIENRSLTFSVELKIHIKTFPGLNISVLSFMFWQISSLPSPGPDWRRAELPPVMKLMMRKPIILWIWRWCASTIRQNTQYTTLPGHIDLWPAPVNVGRMVTSVSTTHTWYCTILYCAQRPWEKTLTKDHHH